MTQWTNGNRAYPYPYGGIPYNLPEARHAGRGTRDLGTDAWARRGRRLSMRRALNDLEGNPARDGRAVWRLVDSFGRALAILEQHSNRWDVNDASTGRLIYSDRRRDVDQIQVQGRGCMATAALERRHALIAFQANDPPEEGDTVVPFRLRAFVDRRALPLRNRRRQLVRGVVDSYDVGCGGSPLDTTSVRAVSDPDFESTQRFVGEDGIRRTYATYNAKPIYRGAIYVLANTPGVHGGGIVRAVIRTGDRFAVVDGFDYCDPNVPEGEPARVRWSYGRVAGTRIWGWLPERC